VLERARRLEPNDFAVNDNLGHTRSPGTRLATSLSWLCLTLSLAQAIGGLSIGWEMPLLDRHAFRQTQTALGARMIEQGGPIFAYEVPVFGAPWSLPLEFPLYQLIVVAVRVALQLPLDQAGRWVASGFYLAILWPLWVFLRELEVPTLSRRIGLASFLVSPLYVHWSRAFLIESTVLFFSVSACALGLGAWRRRSHPRSLLVLMSLCGMLAALIKPTTAFAWLVLLGVCWLAQAGAERPRRLGSMAWFLVAAFVGPLLAAAAWTSFADSHRSANLIARSLLVSTAQSEWSFGTWAQKSSLATWQLLWTRTLEGTLGHAWLFLACLPLGLLLSPRLSSALAPPLALVATYATFTNLHVAHEYYQYATGLLVIVSIAVGLGGVERVRQRQPWLVPSIGALALLQSARAFDAGPGIAQKEGYRLAALRLGQFIRDHTDGRSTLLVYGEDWSSRVPYYAERRAIMNRWDCPLTEPRMKATIEQTTSDGHPIGAVIGCGTRAGRGFEIGRAMFGESAACHSVARCQICVPTAPVH
jgi:hypothetical protein